MTTDPRLAECVRLVGIVADLLRAMADGLDRGRPASAVALRYLGKRLAEAHDVLGERLLAEETTKGGKK